MCPSYLSGGDGLHLNKVSQQHLEPLGFFDLLHEPLDTHRFEDEPLVLELGEEGH